MDTLYDKEKLRSYKERVIEEMHKMQATEQEIALVDDEVIYAAITNGHKPEDVAWALLQ